MGAVNVTLFDALKLSELWEDQREISLSQFDKPLSKKAVNIILA